jgi:hypothetical protein
VETVTDKFCFYSETARELQGTVREKIAEIIAQNAIIYDQPSKSFLCRPIMRKNGKPYNKTMHCMKSHKTFSWSCSCQGWTMKLARHEADPVNQPAPVCSHVAALWEFLKRRNMSIREGKVCGGMQMTFREE